MFKLKKQYHDAIYSSDQNIFKLAQLTGKSLQTVFFWLRKEKQNQLTNLSVLNHISEILNVPVPELTEKIPELESNPELNNRKNP